MTGIDSNEKAIKVAKEHAKVKNLKINYINTELSKIEKVVSMSSHVWKF